MCAQWDFFALAPIVGAWSVMLNSGVTNLNRNRVCGEIKRCGENGGGKKATQIFTRSAVDVRVLCLALPVMGGREREGGQA